MEWAPTLPAMLTALGGRLPDSRVRDRMQAVAEIAGHSGLKAIAALGASGYVVDTVPLALAAAWHMKDRPFETILGELVDIGGDTDTIAAIAGQVAGARGGQGAITARWLSLVPERELIDEIGGRFADYVEGRE
jgi:ADP-ribosyl-[dinitrogen reductase] hydrolase